MNPNDEHFRHSLIEEFGLEKATGILARLSRQISRFGHAAGRFVRHGAPTTPPEILATREATCRACPEWDAAALNGTGRCRKCGCSTWAKLRMATERCPLGKWEALTKEHTESTEKNFEGSLEPSGSEP